MFSCWFSAYFLFNGNILSFLARIWFHSLEQLMMILVGRYGKYYFCEDSIKNSRSRSPYYWTIVFMWNSFENSKNPIWRKICLEKFFNIGGEILRHISVGAHRKIFLRSFPREFGYVIIIRVRDDSKNVNHQLYHLYP